MLDRRHSIRGRFLGQAEFVPAANILFYEERGRLTFAGHDGPAEQRYTYDFVLGHRRAQVSFRDGRAFHELDLAHGETIVFHNCDPDLYEGHFVAHDWTRWESAWKVTGPRKDQEIVTLYTRRC